MDPEHIYKVIEIIKREQNISFKDISAELDLTYKQLQPMIQALIYADFIDLYGGNISLSRLNTDAYIERKDEEYTALRKKKTELEAYLAGTLLILFLLLIGLYKVVF